MRRAPHTKEASAIDSTGQKVNASTLPALRVVSYEHDDEERKSTIAAASLYSVVPDAVQQISNGTREGDDPCFRIGTMIYQSEGSDQLK